MKKATTSEQAINALKFLAPYFGKTPDTLAKGGGMYLEMTPEVKQAFGRALEALGYEKNDLIKGARNPEHYFVPPLNAALGLSSEESRVIEVDPGFIVIQGGSLETVLGLGIDFPKYKVAQQDKEGGSRALGGPSPSRNAREPSPPSWRERENPD